jgi:hypothetical protein
LKSNVNGVVFLSIGIGVGEGGAVSLVAGQGNYAFMQIVQIVRQNNQQIYKISFFAETA